MPERPLIGLDDPSFKGRLRSTSSGRSHISRPVQQIQRRPITNPAKVNIIAEISSHVPIEQQKNRAATPTILPFDKYVALEAVDNKKVKRSNRSSRLLVAMAVIVFMVGIFVSAFTFKVNINAKSQVDALSRQTGQNDDEDSPPDETNPGNISGYRVAPGLPRYIKIPSLKIDARVKPLGVTKNNALKSPSNIYDAGWYDASAKPGDSASNGAMLIDGHVHGPSLPGVFSKLKTIKTDAKIQIQRGDNQVFTYKVVKVQNFNNKNLDLGIALTSVKPGQPGLNLITCSGKFDQKTGQYSERTIAFAVLES